MISKIQETEFKDFMHEYVEVLNIVLFNVVVITSHITPWIPILIWNCLKRFKEVDVYVSHQIYDAISIAVEDSF